MDKTYDIPLHDIKPLVDIQEYSMEYLIGLGVVGVILLLGAIYLLFVWLRYKNRFNIRKEHYKLFNAITYEESKNAAYKLTLYGLTFKDDSPRHQRAFHDLVERLNSYKYKKSVDSFDSETLHSIDIYKSMLDV